jgi:hypothetical protein
MGLMEGRFDRQPVLLKIKGLTSAMACKKRADSFSSEKGDEAVVCAGPS